jgi:hypothetical protein
MFLPASPTSRRREEALLVQARLKALEAGIDRALEVVAKAAAFTPVEIEEVSRLLVEGRIRLPTHARLTVTTTVETIKSRVFGTSEVFTHTADQLCAHQLQPMSIQAAIEGGLLAKLGGQWRWSEATYKRLVPPDPRLVQ